jgi:hypothetical protein
LVMDQADGEDRRDSSFQGGLVVVGELRQAI